MHVIISLVTTNLPKLPILPKLNYQLIFQFSGAIKVCSRLRLRAGKTASERPVYRLPIYNQPFERSPGGGILQNGDTLSVSTTLNLP
jgi:hypothetical protein